MKKIYNFTSKNHVTPKAFGRIRCVLTLFVLLLIGNSAFATDYYWIGKTGGNWGVATNWSTIPNGAPDGAVPGAVDRAIFTEESFDGPGRTITLAGLAAGIPYQCDTLIWNIEFYSATFDMAAQNFNINGSMFINYPTMNISSTSGALQFFSFNAKTETFKTSGVNVPRNIIFNCLAGTGGLKLENELKMVNAANNCVFEFINGHLNLNGNKLTCHEFRSNNPTVNARTLNIAGSTITLNIWTHSTGTGTFTALPDSKILVGTTFTGKIADLYNIVEAGTGTLTGGTFKKIVMNKQAGTINAGTVIVPAVITDTLILECAKNGIAATSYNITAGTTLTINHYLANTTGGNAASDKIQLRSTSNTGAFINYLGTKSGVKLSNVDFYYMNITGAHVPYNVPNSVGNISSAPVGSSNGWTSRAYWIGGTGTWSTTTLGNWSTTSGGTPNVHQTPGWYTTVVFDDKSFTASGQTVTLGGTNGTQICDSMIWENIGTYTVKPTLATGTLGLILYGSMELHKNMAISGTSEYLRFYSTRTGEKITTANVNLSKAVYFFSNTGEWILQDSLKLLNPAGTTAYELQFGNGNLITNGKYVRCATFLSTTNNARQLNIAGSTFDVTTWNQTPGTLTVGMTPAQSASSLIRVTSAFTGRPDDNYNVVEAGNGIFQGGIFKKILLNKNMGASATTQFLRSKNATNWIVTDSLVLFAQPAFNYYIDTMSVIKINKYLGTEGIMPNCTANMVLRANQAYPVFLDMKTGAEVNVENLNLFYVDIKEAGLDLQYEATNGVDLGGSDGWKFENRRLYWVSRGVNSFWNNSNNWSFTPGGAGGACIPTRDDDVYFTPESFEMLPSGQTANVTLDITAECNNMYWDCTDNVNFDRAGFALNIYGSLKLQPNLIIAANTATINFLGSSSGMTIETKNVNIAGHIAFNNPTGEWIFLDDIKLINSTGTTLYNLTFSDGNLNFNGKFVKCATFSSTNNNARRLNIANSTIEVTNWDMNSTGTANVHLTALQTQNSRIKVGVNFTGRSLTNFTSMDHYNIVEAGSGTIQGGRFNKIIVNKYNSIFNSSNLSTSAYSRLTTDSLIFMWQPNDYRCFVHQGSTVIVNNYLGNISSSDSCPKRIQLRSTSAALANFVMVNPLSTVSLGNIDFYYIGITVLP